jgi:hypothetical protein
MTTDLSKIYSNLSSEQLALLAFNHLSDGDDLERQRILAAVPKETYRLNDWYFMSHSDRLGTVAKVIGILYWKAQAVYFMRSFAWLHQQKQIENSQLDDDALIVEYQDIEQQINTAAAKLLGTEKAINDFIDRHGLSKGTIEAMTMTPCGFDVSKMIEGVEPCHDNYRMYTDLLEGMMTY